MKFRSSNPPLPMFGKTKILSTFLAAAALFAAADACGQNVADENRIAAGYYSRQQWSECIEAFQSLIQRFPNSLEASVAPFYIGEASMQAEQYRNAYRSFQKYLVQHPKSELSGRATFRMAEAAYYQRNDQTAIRLMETFLQEHPDDPLVEFALPYLGELQLRKVEPLLASRVFETALQRYPRSRLTAQSTFGLARAYHLLGRLQEAIDTYQLTADDLENPFAAEADIQIAHIFLSQNETEAARQHLNRAVANAVGDEINSEAHYWLARTYIMEDEPQPAFEVLEKVVGEPASESIGAAIYLDAALLSVKLSQSEQGFQWLSVMLEKYPHSKLGDAALHLQIEIAHNSSEAKILEQTEALVQTFHQRHPNSTFRPGVLEKAGRYYYATQKFSQAAEIFERLLNERQHLDSSRALTDRDNWLYLSALAHIGQRDFVAAEANLGQINVTTASDEIRCLTHLALATARFEQRKYSIAIPSFQAYLTEVKSLSNPDQANLQRARHELTLALAETGMWAEAIDSFKRLQKKYNQDPVVNQTAEFIINRALELGQPHQVTELLERVVVSGANSNNIPLYLSSLAWVKYEADEMVQAKELFRRLTEEYPTSELAGPAALAVAKSFDDAKQYDRAAEMYGWTIKHFGDQEFAKIARLRRAHSLINGGDKAELEEAKNLLLAYLAFPGDVSAKDEALYQLGWVDHELGNPAESLAAFERLIQEHPTSKYRHDASLRAAQAKIAQNDFEQAAVSLSQLDREIGMPSALRSRKLFLAGEVAAKQGRWDDVASAMNELLREIDDPAAQTRAMYWLAESNFRQGKFEQAVEFFRQVRQDYMAIGEELHPWIWLRLAQSFGKLEQWKAAQDVAEEAQARFASFVQGYEFDFLHARGLEHDGLLSDARGLYQQVIDSPRGGSTETAAIAQWRIGEILFHQENYSEAIKAYYLVDSNYDYEQWRSAALLQAGKCQEHLQNFAHAKKLYQRLIDQFPLSPHRNAAVDRIERLQVIETSLKTNTPKPAREARLRSNSK